MSDDRLENPGVLSVIGRFARGHRSTIALAVIMAVTSAGTAAAASYLVLSTSNTASTTTTLKSAVNAAVLQITNTNSVGGTSAKGLSITVPTGRPPIVVNSGAGKATNLNADKLDGIDSTGFIRGPVQAWHEVGTPNQPAFGQVCLIDCLTVWTNYGSGFNSVAFFKDPFGIVHLKGVARTTGSGGSASCDDIYGTHTIFTLPAGYRPAARSPFPAVSDNAPARVDVYATGEVHVCFPALNNQGYSLDGITFRAAS
jgi:hypothetical protein